MLCRIQTSRFGSQAGSADRVSNSIGARLGSKEARVQTSCASPRLIRPGLSVDSSAVLQLRHHLCAIGTAMHGPDRDVAGGWGAGVI